MQHKSGKVGDGGAKWGKWQRLKALAGVENLPRNYTEKLISTLGGFVSIMAVYLITTHVMGARAAMPVVASMGATALLLFSVPHGALSQPWPVFMGQVVSAFIGVTVAKFVADPLIGAPLAVALCTVIMQLGRCLHPPGAASALTAVFASDAVREMGYSFVLAPVALNVAVLIVIAVIFNAPFKGRRYPAALHKSKTPPVAHRHGEVEVTHEMFVEAVRQMDTFIDVSEKDLLRLHNLIYDR